MVKKAKRKTPEEALAEGRAKLVAIQKELRKVRLKTRAYRAGQVEARSRLPMIKYRGDAPGLRSQKAYIQKMGRWLAKLRVQTHELHDEFVAAIDQVTRAKRKLERDGKVVPRA